MKKTIIYLLVIVMVCMVSVPVFAASAKASIGINVLLNTEITDDILKDLGSHGKVQDLLVELNALTMKIKVNELAEIQALPYVEAANPDAERKGSPVDTVLFEDFSFGLSSWNMDAINIMDSVYLPDPDPEAEPGDEVRVDYRAVPFDGEGVYVAVLDTGLVDIWRQYFPEERIADEYAIAFGGGGGMKGTVSTQPNKWEHDTSSHGTHVTSTIIGYSLGGAPINGAAPMATVIPVKVLNQNGSGWSSVIAKGIMYVAELKKGPLADFPVVINMSLGGGVLDGVEKDAIDYAIDAGVIIVASAGNEGLAGMGYPGAYEPVISVASAGWINEWDPAYGNWWRTDITDPTDPAEYYISAFSSVELPGQHLDVAAPGSWIVGPYNPSLGKPSYYYMGGTSMASPHVAGIVALMAQQNPALTAPAAEIQLESTALDLGFAPELQGAGLVDAAAALAATP